MKEILTRLFGKGTGVVEQIGGVVDKFVRTKDEKAQFEKEMEAQKSRPPLAVDLSTRWLLLSSHSSAVVLATA